MSRRAWFPAGSSMEEGDVNAPSAEAIIRQILYGNEWFRKELGKTSAESCCPIASDFLPLCLPFSALRSEGLFDAEAHLGLVGSRGWS